MHYKFEKTEEDEKLLQGKVQPTIDNQDYSNVVVKKPWGYEYLAFDNGYCAIWILHIARQRKTSLHAHPNKKTTLIVLNGSVKCRSLSQEFNLGPLDYLEIDKGAFHSTETYSDSDIYPASENGAWVMEIETPSNKGDLIRATDDYGRAGKAYEGGWNLLEYKDDWLKLTIPEEGEVFNRKFMGCNFDVSTVPHPTHGFDISENHFLNIEKIEQTMKLSDYVADFIYSKGVNEIFSVCGGGAMHLVDSFGKHEHIKYIATHHEQAAAMAAEAYSRINGIGSCLVTTGPGGTNAITGVAGAWIDSIPVIFISGQVTQDTLIGKSGVRQFGVQESNIVELVRPITKYAVTIEKTEDIRYEMEKAYCIATSGRPGPVWIDIPLNLQGNLINIDELEGYIPTSFNLRKIEPVVTEIEVSEIEETVRLLHNAKRPVLLIGNGVRLSGAEKEILELLNTLKIPVITSWTANDLIGDNEYHIGHCGIFGDRASNFTVQNADLLLVIGSRLSVPQIGYQYKNFAREAKIIMVDPDMLETLKPSLHIYLMIKCDAKLFIQGLLDQDYTSAFSHIEWLTQCQEWKQKYPVVLPEYEKLEARVNSFYFIDKLSEILPNDAVVVTDMGTAFTCTMQTFKVKYGQRLFTSSGHASMGFGLPGAIGACFANNKKPVICITGEGGLQMNIQELQTIVHYKLPITIFVINNGGYLTIKHMQQNHFGRYVGSEENSGVSFPNIGRIADAYKIEHVIIANHEQLSIALKYLEDPRISKQRIYEIMMPEDQPLVPRLSSFKRPDGTIVSKPIEDLYPFLDRKEFYENMIVEPVNELE